MPKYSKTGPNAACPCGKTDRGHRLKFKRCCYLQRGRPTPAFIEGVNRLMREDTEKQFRKFKRFNKRNRCYLCLRPYDEYKQDGDPCPHWLLRPSGIKKDLVASVLHKRGCFGPQAFLRWIANAEVFATKINDLSGEVGNANVIDLTVTFRNFEWSFSCSEGDLKGHEGSTHGASPHFHFQMRIDGKPFIDYGDYHITFTEDDLISIRVRKGEDPYARYIETHGAGMKDMMNALEEFDGEGMITAPDETTAQFHVMTQIMADEGTTISGDEIADLIKESKRTSTPLWKLMRRLKNVTIQTDVEPGPGVPEKAIRTPRKR